MTSKKSSTAPSAAPAATRLPLKTLRVDDVSLSIWSRDLLVRGQMRTFFSVTIERSYKDRDGAWKYTKSFDRESLGKIVSLCQQASEVIDAEEEKAASRVRSEPDPAAVK